MAQSAGPKRWPTAEEAFLAVEFSDTTIAYDDGRKKSNYAKGGLRELWIVRVAHGDVRVCGGPQTDGSWASADFVNGDTVIAPLAAPSLAIPVGALFEE